MSSCPVRAPCSAAHSDDSRAPWPCALRTDCSGDLFLGQETKPDQFGLTFAGHLTVGAVIADLKTRHGLGSGTGHKLLLAGSSAGGLGAFANADYVTGLLPSVEVKAAPQGGFFFPNVYGLAVAECCHARVGTQQALRPS